MPTLTELFNALALPPESSIQNTELSACPIPGIAHHRIAKNSTGQPILLIKTLSDVEPLPPPLRLENLSVVHGVRCKIWQAGRVVEEDTFEVLICLSQEAAIRNQFLGVGVPFLNCLKASPSPQQVSHFLGMLVELFRALSQPARKSVQGLWGELFLIARASNIETMLTSWHVDPNETCDFSNGACRIEVKCRLGRERKHHFSLEQLSPPEHAIAIVASICTERVGGGSSISDLLSTVRTRVAGNFALLFRLESVVAATLGATLPRVLDDAFDHEMAQETLKFFDAVAVPKPGGNIPREVSHLQFVADLTNVQSIELGVRPDMTGLLHAVQPA